MSPITTAFRPGESYFDHFDLISLEHADFYPDGRDLGENYTYTSWRMSPCAKSGKLSCIHCHTSSGRYRFTGETANDACLPCHAARVTNAAAHTHHPPDKPPVPCVSCHMPTTRFAQMARSDHSMRPPTPAATIAYKSPNACNLCHTKKTEDAHWADKHVRKWHQRDYQAPTLHVAGLIVAARKGDWRRLPEMLQYVTSKQRDEVFATSLIRLLQRCEHDRQWPALLQAIRDPSPLVRSAATARLGSRLTPESIQALLTATGDRFRLVRIRAAAALAALSPGQLSAAKAARLAKATQELEHSLTSRPDDWSSHYNLGNLYLDRGKPAKALAAYAIASRLRPDTILPLVNASMAHARMGRADLAEKSLRRALGIVPNSPAAHFNLALLKAEQGDKRQAEQSLRAALAADPNMPQAAFNLGVLVAPTRPAEGIRWCRKAHELQPAQPRYAYTLAFFLNQSGDLDGARNVLQELVRRHPGYADAYLLLGGIHERRGRISSAREVYRRALQNQTLTPRARAAISASLRTLPPG
jgi:tetratricopeptide (TPR) repeat protein